MRSFRNYLKNETSADDYDWSQPSDGSAKWAKLYDQFLGIARRTIDPFKNINAHHQLVDSLRAVGMGWDASKLDALMPGKTDMIQPHELKPMNQMSYQQWIAQYSHDGLARTDKYLQYHRLLDELFDHICEQVYFDQFEKGGNN